MTARERHALTEASIDSVHQFTARPYRFMYLDVQSPDWLRRQLAQRAPEWGLEVVRFDEALWPHEARKRVVGSIDTDYAIFIDNDVIVDPGWLDALIACADETGAGIVGPLYLWGDGVSPPRIHMAGGKLTETIAGDERVLVDDHLLSDADPLKVTESLRRSPCDFVEYHCMLIRASLLRDGTLLDTNFRCAHEHIDTALSVKRCGFPVLFEPAARVTYLGRADYLLADLPFFRRRWSRSEANANIDAFSRKWNVANDDRSFGGLRRFVRLHVAEVDPVRPRRPSSADRQIPMRREELRQTRSDLLDLAVERGYGANPLATIAEAYRVAHVLAAGDYRPCGRAFVNHLAGTASVLVRYDFRADSVASALLHSAYTNLLPQLEGRQCSASPVAELLGGEGTPIERRARAYSELTRAWSRAGPEADLLSTLSVFAAEIMAIWAANEVDMMLSGEVRYSGRTDTLKPWIVQAMVQVCETLGVSGLSRTLVEAQQRHATAPPELMTHRHSSYRIGSEH
jgi:GT2 family glycosyltransferase